MARGSKRGRHRSNGHSNHIVLHQNIESNSNDVSIMEMSQASETVAQSQSPVDQMSPVPNIEMETPVLNSYASMVDPDKVRQKVKFEWMPVKFGLCQMMGRKEQECRKKGNTRKEWRVVNKEPTIIHNAQQHTLDRNERFSQEANRKQLWEGLKDIAQRMSEAWCVLGDFNSILHKGDRVRGAEVLDSEINQLAECIEVWDLHEMRSNGAYYSWTNKTI
ncbi:hypothetical protein Cgig2_015306 [Carnegiea gigantea]|uniref:Uncharacterized protein n=1 Tax=Carnegiea gigantea TaxID=171969 RepID=A0A9Q1JR05_9CARY|nr:hypothetical protein Cgig2_015306 [Carnegiea gigantea]